MLNPIHDLTNPEQGVGPCAAGLPKKLAAGENFSFYFPCVADLFMHEPLEAIGVHDTFKRSHWAPNGDFQKAIEKHKADFPLN